MPKIKKIELPNGKTVDRQLHDAAVNLLPAEMAEDSLARWVTEYDGLILNVHQERDSLRLFESEWHEDRGQTLIFCYLGGQALQTKLPFYFAALFHIGRMQQVSQIVLETTTRIQQNQMTWASSLSERLGGPEGEERARVILQKLLEASKQYHSRQLNKAKQWWESWRMEVEPLQRDVEVLRRAWEQDRRDEARGNVAKAFFELLVTTNSPSELQMCMSSEGLHFKSMQLSTSPAESDMLGVGLLALSSYMRSEHFEYDSAYSRRLKDEFEHIIWRLISAEEERRIAPQVQIAIDRLKIKYAEKNPFDEFGVGRHPASLALREFVKENKLPNDRPSPWLHAWMQSLEEMPWPWNKPLSKSTMQEESLRSALRLADSTIKKGIDKDMQPNEAWNDFVQRIFEKEWVQKVGIMAGEANKTTAFWTLDEFVAFIEKVVLRLNSIGYSLKTPAKERLRTLLDKTSCGESVYDKDAW